MLGVILLSIRQSPFVGTFALGEQARGTDWSSFSHSSEEEDAAAGYEEAEIWWKEV